MAKFMNLFLQTKLNPLIGSAGASNKVDLEYNQQNFLLMHAMDPNVAGVAGSAVAAGVFLFL
jgi:Na+-transporting methylmalonyl-CoA/oxaloacetate decarboxylase beta subunit